MNFQSIQGVVTSISNFGTTSTNQNAGCSQIFTVQDRFGSIVHFIVERTTYFVNQVQIAVGDTITGFYDADLPVVLIYPPQYRAVAIAKSSAYENVKIDYFDNQLESRDGTLRLNIGQNTDILLENGQFFRGDPGNHYLLVVYGATTRSIPAQTTPSQIIVLCP